MVPLLRISGRHCHHTHQQIPLLWGLLFLVFPMVPVRFSCSEFDFYQAAHEKNHCRLGKPAHSCPWKGWKAGGLCVYMCDFGVDYDRNHILEQECVDHSVTSAPIFCVEHEEDAVGQVHNQLRSWLNWLSVLQQELPLSRNHT